MQVEPSVHEQARQYVLPIAAFASLSALEAQAPRAHAALYLLKILVVAGLLAAFPSPLQRVRVSARVVPAAILVGLVVFAEWVLLDGFYPHFGARTAFDPFQRLRNPLERYTFLTVRMLGLVAIVPVMEELFWRSFLIRYLTRPDIEALAVGDFSWRSFAVVALAFAFVHPEWLAALICAVAYGLLLWRTRSLFACIVAHAVTNLVLGIYILLFHQWKFW